jgi:hypothetical protein
MGGGDLEEALRDLLHVCGRHREALVDARDRCEADVAAGSVDVNTRRALELLEGALRTALFQSALAGAR